MISRELELKVGYENSILREPLTLYVYDRNILLYINVLQYDFKFGGDFNENFIGKNKIHKAVTYIKTPTGKIIKYPDIETEIENDRVKVLISNDVTGSELEVGKHSVQIVLFDTDDSVIHLHPFEITVRDLIGRTGSYDFDYGDDNTDYVSESSLDLISSAYLNNLEDKLSHSYNGNVLKNITFNNELKTENKSIVNAINELKINHDKISKLISEYSEIKTYSNNTTDTESPNVFSLKRTLDNDVSEVKSGFSNIQYIEITNKFHNKINIGETYIYRRTTFPANVKRTYVKWKSSNPSIVKVNRTGKVKGVNNGKATITAFDETNPKICDSFEITVGDFVPVSSVVLDDFQFVINEPGKMFSIKEFPDKIKTIPSNGTLSIEDLDFEIEDETIAKIVGNGLYVIQILKEGTTKITATLRSNPKKKATAKLEVIPKTTFEIKKYPFSLYKGDIIPILYNVTPSDKKIEWECTGDATLRNGKLYLDRVGSFTITGTVKNEKNEKISDSKTFEVKEYNLKLINSITIKQPSEPISGMKGTLSFTTNPNSGSIDRRCWWTIDDTENFSIDDSLQLNGFIFIESKTGKNLTVTVTATSVRSSSITDTVEVKFEPAKPTKIEVVNKDFLYPIEISGLKETYPIYLHFEPENCNRSVEWLHPLGTEIAKIESYDPINGRALLTLTGKTGISEIVVQSKVDKNVGDDIPIHTKIPVKKISFSSNTTPDDPRVITYLRDYSILGITDKINIEPANASELDFIWESSDTSVATVTNRGQGAVFINKIGNGHCYITCRYKHDESIRAVKYYSFGEPIKFKCAHILNNPEDYYKNTTVSIYVNDTKYETTGTYLDSTLDGNYKYTSYTFDNFEKIKTIKFPSNTIEVTELSLYGVPMDNVFYDLKSLQRVTLYGSSKEPASATSMFKNCTNLNQVNGLSNYEITDATSMFENCTSLQDIPYFNFDKLKKADSMFSNTGITNVYTTIPTITVCRAMFNGCKKLNSVDITMPDVEIIDDMFSNCENLESAKIHSPNKTFTSASRLFAECSNLTYAEITGSENITNMSNMFRECYNLPDNGFELATDSVEDMEGMFSGCWGLTYPKEISAPNVKTMRNMFNYCKNLKDARITNTTSRLENTSRMFYWCYSLTRVPENLNTRKVTDMSYMFDSCKDLTLIDNMLYPELKYEFELDTSNVINAEGMFQYVSNMKSIKIDFEKLEIASYLFKGCSCLEYVEFTSPTDNLKLIGEMFKDCVNLKIVKNLNISESDSENWPRQAEYLFSGCRSLTTVEDLNVSGISNIRGLFEGCSSLTTITNLNTSGVTDMSYMFSGCKNLSVIPDIDTSDVTNMSYMFNGCIALELQSTTTLNTSKVTDMSYMFSGCRNISVIPDIDAGNVNNMSYMFSECTNLPRRLSFNLKPTRAVDMTGMFKDCKLLVEITNLDAKQIKSANSMFKGCISLENISDMDITLMEDMSYMFEGCTKLKLAPNISNNNYPKIDTSYMFKDCTSLESVTNLNTSKMRNMNSMFYNCGSLKTVNNFDVNNVTDMTSMFYNCNNLESVSLSNITSVESVESMFFNCSNLRTVRLSGSSFEKTTTMRSMFENCSSLIEVPDTINTSSVTNMSKMFKNCQSLTYAPDFISTSKVIDMSEIFYDCFELKTVPILDTESVKYFSYGFKDCENLIELPLIILGNCDVVGLFFNCSKITEINIEKRGTIESFRYMFSGCSSLIKAPKIDYYATDFFNTFSNCYSLSELPDLEFGKNSTRNFSYTFYNCRNMTGVVPNRYWDINNYPNIYCDDTTFFGCYLLNNYDEIPDWCK